MGLDVYVGPLTRYYTGDWETLVAQAAREEGIEYRIVRTGDDQDDSEVDSHDVLEAVEVWRAALAETLGEPLDWVEDFSEPYFTDKPGWDGYGSLQVLAASVERGQRKRPTTAIEDWRESRTWRKAADGDNPRFPHLYLPWLWLPVALGFTVDFEEFNGTAVTIGSSIGLLQELESLNKETYDGSADHLASWRRSDVGLGGSFDDAAKFGLAVFLELAAISVSKRLPMCLDY